MDEITTLKLINNVLFELGIGIVIVIGLYYIDKYLIKNKKLNDDDNPY